MRRLFNVLSVFAALTPLSAQGGRAFTRADTLRGSYTTPARVWWDVTFYDLHVQINPSDSTIKGWNGITYRVLTPAREMQIDLMEPLEIDSMIQDGKRVTYRREGAAFFATLTTPQKAGARKTIRVYYHGKPKVAPRPPWDGGFSWGRDSLGNPWVVTTDQGMGASVWWPNKDTQADEPDSQRVALTVPDPLMNVSNGRLRSVTHNPDKTTTWEWFAVNPINNYAIAVATGAYTHFSDTLMGEKGKLSVDYYPLAIHLDAAKRQWPTNAIPMLKCFEHWFGPYPWYEDGYKLIEVPNSGMEHQTAVSYGNGFRDGYGGRGASLRFHFDFIIIHESAHEWFANNITAKDQADMWIHESFANYAEGLYAECKYNSADSGAAHIRLNSRGANRTPLIAHYEVNEAPSQDMYGKGGWMLHTIRQVVDNSDKWRQVLRGLGKEFYHQTVKTKQIEDYMTKASGKGLTGIFDQYLRTIMIPNFEYKIEGTTFSYHWTNVIPGFNMPIKVMLADNTWSWVTPTETWKTATMKLTKVEDFKIDPDFLVTASRQASQR